MGIERSWWVALTVNFACMVVMSSSEVTLIPSSLVVDALIADRYTFQWTAGVALLGAITGMTMFSWFSSQHGIRRTYLGGHAVFILGSLIGMMSGTVTEMGLARMLQGFGKGVVLTGSLSVLGRDFPLTLWRWRFHSRRISSVVFIVSAAYISVAISVWMGGLITHSDSWRWIYFGLALAGGITWVGAYYGMIDDCPKAPVVPHFEWVGYLSMVLWLGGFIILLDRGQRREWLTSAFISAVFWITLFSFIFFVWWELVIKAPYMDLHVLSRRPLFLYIVLKSFVTMALDGMLVFSVRYLSVLRNYPRGTMAEVLFWPSMMMFAGLAFSVLFGTQHNLRKRVLTGFLMIALASGILSQVDLSTDKWWFSRVLLIHAFAIGMTILPILRIKVDGLTPEEYTRSAGLSAMVRVLPGFAITAILTVNYYQSVDYNANQLRSRVLPASVEYTLVSERLTEHFIERGSPPAEAHEQASHTIGTYMSQVSELYSMRELFQWMVIVSLLGGMIALWIPVPKDEKAYRLASWMETHDRS